MNEELEEDLLSAYLDDELGPEQRAECERLLATSSKAQQELKELKQLSKLIDELPDHSCIPDSFERPVEGTERKIMTVISFYDNTVICLWREVPIWFNGSMGT